MKELLAVPSFGDYAAGTTTELLLKEVQEMLIANSAALRQPGIGVGDTGAGLVGMGEEILKAWLWVEAHPDKSPFKSVSAMHTIAMGGQGARATAMVLRGIGGCDED